jgi:hypothetical protein
MQLGILKHYAHVLPQIFAERILWEDKDLATVAAWGNGHLTIDVMQGTCVRSTPAGTTNESLWVVDELQAWFAHALQAALEVTFTARGDAPGDFDLTFDCMATISSGGRTFIDHLNVSPRVRNLSEQTQSDLQRGPLPPEKGGPR